MPIGLVNREERRRRVLREEVSDSQAIEANDGGDARGHWPRKKKRRYALSARRKCQPSVMDLVPRRWWSVLGICTALVACCAGLATWGWISLASDTASVIEHSATIPTTSQMAVKATEWLASMLCLAAALVCLQIYLVRRHRGDDYRGHYTLWLWMIGLCLVASFNISVGIHRVLVALCWESAFQGSVADHAIWLDLAIAIPILVVAARLIWEMWESRACWGIGLAALGCLADASLGLFPQISQTHQMAMANTLILAIPVTVCISFLLYARYTLLDAHGLLPAKVSDAKDAEASELDAKPVSKPTRKRKSKRDADVSEPSVDQPATPEPAVLKAHRPEKSEDAVRPKSKRERRASKAASVDSVAAESSERVSQGNDVDDSDPEQMIHSLSSAKKKRQSKKQRRQQRRAA